MIKYFELVRSILDNKLPGVKIARKLDEQNLYREMKESLDDMTKEWNKGQRPSITYLDAIYRMAYIYSNLGVNACLVERAIESNDALKNHIKNRINQHQQLDICAFGGGPGTELLAFSNYFLQAKIPQAFQVKFIVLDQVREWQESFDYLEQAIDSYLGPIATRPFHLRSSFASFDMADTKDFIHLVDYFDKDVFVLNYVVSEIFDAQANDALIQLVSNMAQGKRDDAYFIILDRDQDWVRDSAIKLCKNSGLFIDDLQTVKDRIPFDQFSCRDVLDDYKNKINRSTRCYWGKLKDPDSRGAFYIIAHKKSPEEDDNISELQNGHTHILRRMVCPSPESWLLQDDQPVQ